ncbi:major facilitator superfamily domain-containing protein [Pisolithus orientalis]|uniref:major facilitator superfamily domain-containing protein n=1 Tax=Pisolithus orientalis TaxID=936130 RepID=UPI002223F8A3|nr:major facilitator superfamily domain-containing protein [Pisolithus orientalis]KAI5995345.1 major facilitator superfamily domain-containing protein [Pisolithus orientalis]
MTSLTSSRINFKDVVVNPANLKCSSLPLFSLRNQYSVNFHLSWLGFIVAFLSWFAFAPLIPDVIKEDLHLTSSQVGNSNVVSLCATLIVRFIAGPLVDRFGPRKVMAGLLLCGAIPSGLAGTAHTANGLYIVRFFIGILGGTFVACQAWTTAFFDKNVVGTANALAGGWGNAGGGVTFIIMVSLYNSLVSDGLTPHVAWRAAFAIVPVPFLLTIAVATLVFGTDHPAGKWSDRHKAIAHGIKAGGPPPVSLEHKVDSIKKDASGDVEVTVSPVNALESELDFAVNEPVTWALVVKVITRPLTWLPALAYLSTFGYELAIDANLANVLFSLYKSPNFGQTKAGYIASIFGLLNIFTRPLGGYFGDLIYQKFGVPGKKYLLIFLGAAQGLLSIGLGLYIDNNQHPSLTILIVLLVLISIACEAANGVNFSLVPHCNPCSNGFMSGIVGGTGNLGGIMFAMIFRFQPTPLGKALWISGIIAVAINLLLTVIRVPKV